MHWPNPIGGRRQWSLPAVRAILILCLLGLLTTPQASLRTERSCTPPPDGLVSWWPLDEPGGMLAADLIGSNPGTLVNGPKRVMGRVSGALSFDGINDFVQVAHNPDLDPGPASFSIEAWIKTTKSIGIQTVVSKDECGQVCLSNVSASHYYLQVNDGKANAELDDTHGRATIITGTSFIADGLFHHLGLVRDVAAVQFRLYVDGVLDASVVLQTRGAIKDDDGDPDPLVIGARFIPGKNGKEEFFSGVIDELSLYHRALTASEMQAIFRASSQGKCPPAWLTRSHPKLAEEKPTPNHP